MGVDRSGKIVRYFDINARLMEIEDRLADVEDEVSTNVGTILNDTISKSNSFSFAVAPVPALPKFVAKTTNKPYLTLSGVGYLGNEASTIQNTTLDKCKTACNNASNCNAYVFNKNTSTCYIETSLTDTPVLNPNTNTYLVKGSGLGTASGVTYLNNSVSAVASTSSSDCLAKCNANNKCIAGEFDPTANICYLQQSLSAVSLSNHIIVS